MGIYKNSRTPANHLAVDSIMSVVPMLANTVSFTYTAASDSCLEGRSYTVVILLTGN